MGVHGMYGKCIGVLRVAYGSYTWELKGVYGSVQVLYESIEYTTYRHHYRHIPYRQKWLGSFKVSEGETDAAELIDCRL